MSPPSSEVSSVANDHPPAPWRLRGQGYASVWMVPVERLQVRVDPAFELLTFAGRACVATCFVDYQEGSVLTYRELFGAVAVRMRGTYRYGITIPLMWVDSEPSMRGGRALWDMPKEMARFELDHQPPGEAFSGACWDSQGRELARVRFHSQAGLPPRIRLPLGLMNLQVLHGRVHSTKAVVRCSPRWLQGAHWSIPVDSPLAALGIAGARPWLSLQVRDFGGELPAATPVS